jgi:hypothetical protein
MIINVENPRASLRIFSPGLTPDSCTNILETPIALWWFGLRRRPDEDIKVNEEESEVDEK